MGDTVVEVESNHPLDQLTPIVTSLAPFDLAATLEAWIEDQLLEDATGGN